MLDLVPYISTHQGISTEALAAEFSISEEELLSDLTALWMCGDSRFDLIDIHFDSGYVTIQNADSLNLTRSLSHQELIAILLGLNLIEKEIVEERTELLSEISTLKSKLGQGLARMVDASPNVDSAIMKIISEALAHREKIAIRYFSPTDDHISERVVIPLSLYSEGQQDYLLAFCESAQAHRTFRCDRIESALPQEPYSTQDFRIPEKSLHENVAVKIYREFRRSRESLGIENQGRESIVSIESFSPEWLLRSVISSAGAMEVISSTELRKGIHHEATLALALYR
jgi:proteasome accessory factor C